MPFSSNSPTPFCGTELQRALKEQAFGVKSFTMTTSTHDSASASVVLLEGQKIVVQLTMQGYTIVNSNSGNHETIENLLQSVSRLYSIKRQDALVAALSRLS